MSILEEYGVFNNPSLLYNGNTGYSRQQLQYTLYYDHKKKKGKEKKTKHFYT